MDKRQEDLLFTHICRVNVGGSRLRDSIANRKIIISWLTLDEIPSAQWFESVLKENPSLKESLSWEPIRSAEWQRAVESRELEQDKATFEKVRREHNLSGCKANFDLWRASHSLGGMVSANAEELSEYQQERIDQHNQVLLNAPLSKLRATVRIEGESRQQADHKNASDEQLRSAKERDGYLGFPALPNEYNGQKLNAVFLRACSAETLKFLSKKFGSSQVTARLRDLS